MTHNLLLPVLRCFAKFKNVQKDFAKACGESPSTVSGWYIRTQKIPLGKVLKVSQVTGIPPHELRPDRPDFFPPPQE